MHFLVETKSWHHLLSNIPWLFLADLLCIFSLINLFFIIPPVFNFYIIPKIEKKVGRKLIFIRPVYQIMLFGKFFARHIEIMKYILAHYLRIKWRFSDSYALARVKYPREMFSKCEIFWCAWDFFNYVVFFAILIVQLFR